MILLNMTQGKKMKPFPLGFGIPRIVIESSWIRYSVDLLRTIAFETMDPVNAMSSTRT